MSVENISPILHGGILDLYIFIKSLSIWKKLSQYKRRFLSVIAPQYNTKRIFKFNFGKDLNLKNPIDINEKLQYLKLYTYYKNDVITQCVDKYRIREYLEERKVEGLFLPKLYGVYNTPSQIEWEKLPSQFVIKCNHGCGFNLLCPNKDLIDQKATEKILKKWMHEEFWKEYCELQYKFVKKKIIVEEYLGDNVEAYKFYCFNGSPMICYVSSMGEIGIKDYYLDYFDMEWNKMPYQLRGHKNNPQKIKKPNSLKTMINIARKLSENFPFVRVDLYDIEEKIYISELTFIPTGGFMHLLPKGTSEKWGSWLKL